MKMHKKVLALMLSLLMAFSLFPTNYVNVDAAAKKATVTNQAKLNKALKNRKATSITAKTNKKVTLTTKAKNYKKKTLTISGGKITFKNSGVFKKINIKKVKKFIEKGKGNKLNITASKASVEIAKSAKKTSVGVNKSKAQIALKIDGSVSSVNVGKAATLTVTGTPKGTVNIKNTGEGSVLSVNPKGNAAIALNASAKVTIGASVKSAKVTLAAGVKADITNKSGKGVIVVMPGGKNQTIPAGSSKSVTNNGKKGAEDKDKPGSVIPSETALTVTFESNGGTAVPSQTVEKGEKALEPQEPRFDGFTFKGWCRDDSLKHRYNFDDIVNSSITLYAKWKVNDNSDNVHTVTFALNDGSDGAYELSAIQNNHEVSRPVKNPTRVGYTFTGWYEDEALVNEFDFSEPVVDNITIYAGWGNPEAAPDSDESLYDAGSGGDTVYSISDLQVNGDTVQAVVNTNSSSILVVGFYDANGYFEEGNEWRLDEAENYGNLAVRTPQTCERARITLNGKNDLDLPDHYILVGSLYDGDSLEPVCEKFYCADYTEENERFEAQTVDDFAGQEVLNFDESTTDNFGVLAEDVKSIYCDNNANVLSVESEDISEDQDGTLTLDTFTISNPDDTVTSLQAGDKIVIYDHGTPKYLTMIGSIEVNAAGDIVITETLDYGLNEFYTVLKVDMEQDELEPEEPELTTMAEVFDADTTATVSIATNISRKFNDHLKLTGELKGTAELTFTAKYDAKLFRKDYFECSIISKIKGSFSITLEGSLDNGEKVDKQLEGVKVPFQTPVPGLEAYTAVTFPIEISLKGSVSATIKFEIESGFKYNSNSGKEDIAKKSRSVDFKAEAEFEVKAGPKFTVGVCFLKEVLDGKVEAQIGAKITATITVSQDDEISNVDSKHACYACLSGKAKWFAEAKVKLEYKIIKDVWEGEAFNVTILSVEGWLNAGGVTPGEFYLSLANAQDSVLGGKIKFGWGSCPNEKYRTTVQTYDKDDNKVNGIKVTITKNNGDVVKSGKTDLNTYLYNGTYKVSGTINGKDVSSSFVISGNKKTVKLTENSTSTTKITGSVRDAETQNWIEGAEISFRKGSMTISTVKSGADGSFIAELPADSYEIVISKNGYVTVTTNQTIVENEQKYMGVTDLVPGEGNGKGGFSGSITDAVTGDPVDGVKLQIRAGANSPDTGDILIELRTDENGYYEYKPSSFFGIKRGLSAGQYTVTMTKSGYIKSSFNIVVKDDEDVDGQNATISPGLSEDEYRIVLRWGANPSDLDSHYNAVGLDDHIYYSYKDGSTANLDVDDTSSYGPETVTVTDFSATSGFVYSVHDYSNRGSDSSTALSNSGAYITVYHGQDSPIIYNVPVGVTGTVWNVFRVTSTGRIEAINSFENIEDPGNVGAALAN